MPHAERDLALSELRERIGRLESRGRGPYVPCASSGAFTQFCRLRLRYVAPYHEALGRLGGRSRPDLMTRCLNCLWIGRECMAD